MFDRHAQRQGLALTGHDHDDLARIEDSLDAHRKRHAWHSGDVVVEEARVSEDRVVCKSLDPRPRRGRRTRLVKCDVPVLADAAEEELNASGGLDLCLELVTLVDQVWRVSVEDVYVF